VRICRRFSAQSTVTAVVDSWLRSAFAVTAVPGASRVNANAGAQNPSASQIKRGGPNIISFTVAGSPGPPSSAASASGPDTEGFAQPSQQTLPTRLVLSLSFAAAKIDVRFGYANALVSAAESTYGAVGSCGCQQKTAVGGEFAASSAVSVTLFQVDSMRPTADRLKAEQAAGAGGLFACATNAGALPSSQRDAIGGNGEGCTVPLGATAAVGAAVPDGEGCSDCDAVCSKQVCTPVKLAAANRAHCTADTSIHLAARNASLTTRHPLVLCGQL